MLPGGGTAERTRKLAKYLALAGAEVRVVAIDGSAIQEEFRDCRIETYVTGSVRLRYVVPLVSPRTLARHVQWADCCHLLGHWNLLSVATARAARTHGKPYVLCPAGEFAGLIGGGAVKRVFHAVFGRSMVDGAARLIAITDAERQEMIARFARPPGEVVTIPNGAEEPDPAYMAKPSGLPEGAYALFLGRLTWIKGPDLLLDAFSRIAKEFPGLSLVVAGRDFGLEAALRAKAATAPLAGRVAFVGFLDERRRTAALRHAECLVLPSRSEAMSMVAVEAGVEGIPVVVTDRCGLDVVAEIDGGEVCPATPEDIGRAMARLLSDPERKAKGERWRSHVLEHYRWKPLVDRLLGELETLR